jgi:hypothetical protein
MLAKQHALRERLSAVDQAIQAQRRAIVALETDAVMTAVDLGAEWKPAITVQDARQRLTRLLDEQRTLQEAQPYVNRQVEEVKDTVRQALWPEVQAFGRPVMARLVHAMEELAAAQQAAQDCASKAYRLVGSHMVPLGLIQDPSLTQRLKYLHDTLMQKFTWTEEP